MPPGDHIHKFQSQIFIVEQIQMLFFKSHKNLKIIEEFDL